MTKAKTNALERLPRKGTHHIYSFLDRRRLPKGRAFTRTRRELAQVRDELIAENGGEGATTTARVLIDNVCEGLAVQKLIGMYLRQYGILDGQAAAAGRVELAPVLGKNFVSYANMVRQGIMALEELKKGRQVPPQAEIEAILTSYSRADSPGEAGPEGQGEATAPAPQFEPADPGEDSPPQEPGFGRR